MGMKAIYQTLVYPVLGRISLWGEVNPDIVRNGWAGLTESEWPRPT